MPTQLNKSTAFHVVCMLVLSLLMLPGTATAQGLTGFTQFCDAASYDNASPQTTGLFTDIRRGRGINAQYDADPANCQLNITGAVGSASDMWITLLGSPGNPTPPTFNCVEVEALVSIHKFDNRKAVGFVTNYDSATGKGLFFGLYNNGNSDAMTLSTFDGTTGQLTGTVATKFLGSKIQENVWYELELDICNDGENLSVFGVVELATEPEDPGFECGENPSQVCLSFEGDLPAGISEFGQIGIAGQAKSSVVDSSVKNFEWFDLGI